ncbi:MAG: 2-oxoacid:acceptor oxidoreductase family protein [Candidatus Hodarchaeota archaeon]
MNEVLNILVAGVGGQGNLVCSRVLADAAVAEGSRPVIGETFGASRRGGTVFTHVRIAQKDVGPLIPAGTTDFLLGLEPLEALRAAVKYAGPKTIAILSTRRVETKDSLAGLAKYPDVSDIINSMSEICMQVHSLDPTPSLENLGSLRVLNSYMLGALAGLESPPLSLGSIRTAVWEILGSDKVNLSAFDAGAKDIRT